MGKFLTRAMVVTLALCLVTATIAFGAVKIVLAAPVYGLAGLLALLWAAKLVFAEGATWKHSPVHLPVLAFLFYAGARYFSSPIEYDSRLELFQVLVCGMVYFAAACNIYHTRDRAILFVVLVVLALAEAGYGMWQFFTHAPTVFNQPRPEAFLFRGGGTYICPNHLAGFLEMILGLVLAAIALKKASGPSVEKSALYKVFLVYAALMILGGIVTTLSRAGWIATAVAVFLVLLWGDWRSRVMWLRLAVAGAALVTMAIIAWKVDTVRDYITLTFATPHGSLGLTDPTVGERTYLWRATVSMIKDYPVFGTGPGTWQWFHFKYRYPNIQVNAEYAHNDILNFASDYGLVGFTLLLAALICFYWHATRLAKAQSRSETRAFAVGSLTAVTAIVIHSWFDFNMHIFANALLLTTLIGLTVALEDPARQFPRFEMKPLLRYSLASFLAVLVLAGVWPVTRTALAYRSAQAGKHSKMVSVDRNQAIADYYLATEYDPRFPEAYAQIGELFRAKGEWQRADPLHDEARKKHLQKAAAFYEKALSLNPYNSDTLMRLGRTYEDLSEKEQAAKTFERALEVDPNSTSVNLATGLFYRRLGDEERAKKFLEKSQQVSRAPNLPAAINMEELLQPR